METINLNYIINAVVFSTIGIILLGAGLYAFDRFTPFQLWKEVCEEHNNAIAIIVASAILGISIIIASAIH